MTGRRGGQRGVIRVALLFAAFLASLSLVVWRQSRALEMLRAIDEVRRERAVVEAQRTALVRELDVLESRGRITRLAEQEFGMRVPHGDEIVLLPLDGPTPTRPSAPPAPTRVAGGSPGPSAGGPPGRPSRAPAASGGGA